jgi:hypothetical protein
MALVQSLDEIFADYRDAINSEADEMQARTYGFVYQRAEDACAKGKYRIYDYGNLLHGQTPEFDH